MLPTPRLVRQLCEQGWHVHRAAGQHFRSRRSRRTVGPRPGAAGARWPHRDWTLERPTALHMADRLSITTHLDGRRRGPIVLITAGADIGATVHIMITTETALWAILTAPPRTAAAAAELNERYASRASTAKQAPPCGGEQHNHPRRAWHG